MIKKYKEVILYLIFGVLTTVVNIATYYVCTRLFQVDAYVSNIIAWVLSVLFAFITNKTIVFESKGKNVKNLIFEMSSFFGFRVLSLGIDMAAMYVMLSILNVNDLIAKIIANVIVVILNYVFSKLFIFKKDKTVEV